MALKQFLKPESKGVPMSTLKKLFWAYFLLLIFEGALRKWVLPELSALLLVIRDPVGILILVETFRTNKWPEKWSFLTGILTAGLLALCVAQVILVDNPLVAALYGLRSYLLPFPVAFAMGENLDAEDLRKFGICTLILMIPETLLEIAQYLAPANSFLNAGAYKGGGQIGYVGGHVRASGTFSFVVGPADFVPMAAVFILYGFVKENFAPRWLLWTGVGAVILSVPVVGSRGCILYLAAIAGCALISGFYGVKQFFQLLKYVLPVLAVLFLVSLLPVFAVSSRSLNERISVANGVEGGSFEKVVERRTVNPVVERIMNTNYLDHPVGLGMGQGAAAVTTLLKGHAAFVAGEGEIDRAMNELGPLPGLFFSLFRMFLALLLIIRAFAQAREHEPFALLLMPLMLTAVAMGILEQPTGQGFMVIWLAFTLAAIKPKIAAQPVRSKGAQPKPLSYGLSR